jgi:hypothetical protein
MAPGQSDFAVREPSGLPSWPEWCPFPRSYTFHRKEKEFLLKHGLMLQGALSYIADRKVIDLGRRGFFETGSIFFHYDLGRLTVHCGRHFQRSPGLRVRNLAEIL